MEKGIPEEQFAKFSINEGRRANISEALKNMVLWIDDLPSPHEDYDFKTSETDPEIIDFVNKVAHALPIKGGYPERRFEDMLEFWKTNGLMFTTAYENHESFTRACELKRQLEIKGNEANNALIKYQRRTIIKLPGVTNRLINAKEDADKAIDEQQQVVSELYAPAKEIMNNIDCRLPTFLIAQKLLDSGYEVAITFKDTAEHPWLFVTHPEKVPFALEANGGSYEAKAVIRIHETTQDKIIKLHERMKKTAFNNGYIKSDDAWPLPFEEDTILLFDEFFILTKNAEK